MAELLLRVVDKTSPDPYRDARLTKRGDVIVVCPDGWNWGLEELASPDWRILRLPALSVSEARALLAEEPETDPTQPSRVRQRRAFRLNLTLPLFASLSQPRRPIEDLPISLLQFRAAVQRKPALVDPAILGSSSFVIG